MALEVKGRSDSIAEMPSRRKLVKLLSTFRTAEIGKKKTEETYDQHFDDIDPKLLTMEDLTIFHKFLTKRLTYDDLAQHKEKIFRGRPSSKRRISSMALNGWISNYLSNPEQLKWFDPHRFEDQGIFQKFEKETLTPEELRDYEAQVERRPEGDDKRYAQKFLVWLRDELAKADWWKKKIEKPAG